VPAMTRFDRTTTAEQVAAGHRLDGKNALITGGTSGLGLETARVLASIGASVTVTGRDRRRGAAIAARLAGEAGRPVRFERLDLGSLSSVRDFAGRYAASGLPLHILINNAGIMATPLSYTADGFESQFGTNHLGHFALTAGLLPALRAAAGARVIVLSSRAHRRGDVMFDDPNYRRRPYDPWEAYGQSKTANALFAVGVTRQHAADGISANALMPGAINTGLQGHLSDSDLRSLGWVQSGGTLAPPAGWKTVPQGAATTVWAALAPELEGAGGHYLEDCAIAQPWLADGNPPNGHYLPYALDPGRAALLWDLSAKLTRG
jgi:NAD(P)-dependent dehydrogenase (short-subunit alcohol dehydrogenase family)